MVGNSIRMSGGREHDAVPLQVAPPLRAGNNTVAVTIAHCRRGCVHGDDLVTCWPMMGLSLMMCVRRPHRRPLPARKQPLPHHRRPVRPPAVSRSLEAHLAADDTTTPPSAAIAASAANPVSVAVAPLVAASATP
jgi:hypothetical protein